MSHHLDSPLARQDHRLNITDLYVFDDGDATVLIMNAGTSLAGADLPTSFHDEARYEFRVHLDGADVETLAYRFAFEAPGGDGAQAYSVHRLYGDVSDATEGEEVAGGQTGETVRGADGMTVWAGRALDPFFLDLKQLAAVDRLVQHGEEAVVTGYLPGQAANTFAGSTIGSIVLRIPHDDSCLFPDRMIRVWSTARLATDAGGRRQIGRTGLPMIWPIFRDADSDAASHSNETQPADDAASYGKAMGDLVAATVRRLGTSARPEAYAQAVVQRLLPDTLPYQIGTPAIFGFTDINGRALGDNAPEVVFSLVTNCAVSTGLPPESTADTRRSAFPFVVPASAVGA